MINFVATSSQRAVSASTATPPANGTICFWYTPTTVTGVQQIWYQSATFRIVLGFTIGAQIQTYLYRKSNRPLTSTTLTAGTLYHVTCTWNSTTTNNTIYFNAVSVASDTNTGDTVGATSINIAWDGTTNFLNAKLEDLRLYSRVLTLAEIESIFYSKGCDNIVDGLVNRWPLVQEQSTGIAITGVRSIKDYINPGNDLTPTNSPTYGDSRLKMGRAING